MTSKPSEEFERFDKAMDKILSVTKEELDTFPNVAAAVPNLNHSVHCSNLERLLVGITVLRTLGSLVFSQSAAPRLE
jgi:hypothetical protein